MKRTLTILAVALTFIVPAGLYATGTHHPAAKPAPKKIVSAVCPVMGYKIPDVTKAVGKSVYKGKTYYFCCGMCKPRFDKNPAKYAK